MNRKQLRARGREQIRIPIKTPTMSYQEMMAQHDPIGFCNMIMRLDASIRSGRLEKVLDFTFADKKKLTTSLKKPIRGWIPMYSSRATRRYISYFN